MPQFSKPYPPDPITYLHYDTLVDALEARFGSGADAFIRDRAKIVNSRGNIWERAAGNVQLAIDDVYADAGGAVWLPKGKVTETQPWTLDEVYPVHVFGAGMCWHDLDYGTMIRFNVAGGVHCVDIGKVGDAVHFGGLYDMALFPGSGDQDVVHLDRVSDWHMDRVYINQPKRHGLHVESTGDSWNLWVKDCLIENPAQAERRFEAVYFVDVWSKGDAGQRWDMLQEVDRILHSKCTSPGGCLESLEISSWRDLDEGQLRPPLFRSQTRVEVLYYG